MTLNNNPHVEESLTTLNNLYDKFKDRINNLHDLLWHVMVNNVTDGKLCCFVTNYTPTGLVIGIAYANESGYQPTPAWFVSGTKYDEATKIIAEMTKEVFHIEEDAAMRIIISSMRKENKSKSKTYGLYDPSSAEYEKEVQDVEEMTEDDAKKKNDELRQQHSDLRWIEYKGEENY